MTTTKLYSIMIFLSLFFFLLRFSCADDNELWCVAKNNAEDSALQSAIDWACGPGGANCEPIQQGGKCFEPQDLQSHASYAFNDYFVRNGFALSACDFSGTAAPISLDPSHDKCIFPSSSSARNGNFSGSTTGSSTGEGPADMSSASSLQLKSSLSTLSIVILIMATTAYSRQKLW